MENEPELDLAFSDPRRSRAVQSRDVVDPRSTPATVANEEAKRAPILARLGAGTIDLLIMGSINIAVLYLTLRVAGLQPQDVLLLPMVPLAAFLLLLNGGYFATFTAASGQTIGKMAAGIRVVTHSADGRSHRVSFGTALFRAAGYVASILPVGLGFAPILFASDGRALHDRLSDTRVVKA
jgi:uncharacterized RDD family membrane protein YckC